MLQKNFPVINSSERSIFYYLCQIWRIRTFHSDILKSNVCILCSFRTLLEYFLWFYRKWSMIILNTYKLTLKSMLQNNGHKKYPIFFFFQKKPNILEALAIYSTKWCIQYKGAYNIHIHIVNNVHITKWLHIHINSKTQPSK